MGNAMRQSVQFAKQHRTCVAPSRRPIVPVLSAHFTVVARRSGPCSVGRMRELLSTPDPRLAFRVTFPAALRGKRRRPRSARGRHHVLLEAPAESPAVGVEVEENTAPGLGAPGNSLGGRRRYFIVDKAYKVSDGAAAEVAYRGSVVGHQERKPTERGPSFSDHAPTTVVSAGWHEMCVGQQRGRVGTAAGRVATRGFLSAGEAWTVTETERVARELPSFIHWGERSPCPNQGTPRCGTRMQSRC